ncbi:mechanosensitive ion channel family protein [Pontibacter vulgaris]|uniref:mechanosensitive ion channel family protein n=1 Tax=Pontibacter vulgaris TaxID=2905679 RepID=UPI001FA802E6|nr:mechanosensitive ion channel domain-containing protein [Pontibacter vulgaris]
MIDFDKYRDLVTNFFLIYGIKIISAIFILVIGLWIVNRISRLIDRLMVREGVDASLRPFLSNIFSIALRVLLLVVVIGQLGIEMTSFIAVLGSVGLAIGLALQGSLSNFAGGVLILTIKPFRVGDFVEAQGQSGTVHLINIFNTVIKTADNKTVYIPNGPLANSVVVNYNVEATRRLELNYTISIHNNIGEVRQLLQSLISEDPRILKEPAPAIVVTNFAEYAITITLRVWCKREDYGNLLSDLNERAKEAFDAAAIQMPVPRREVTSKVME